MGFYFRGIIFSHLKTRNVLAVTVALLYADALGLGESLGPMAAWSALSGSGVQHCVSAGCDQNGNDHTELNHTHSLF
jgi:hypothetical protein